MLVILYSFAWSDSNSSRYVSLYVGDEMRYIIDLYEEKDIEVDGFLGVSKLEVVNGKVRFIESPCSTHFCLRSGWLNPTIGLIACLPNGVSLQYLNHNKAYDAINF
jgi:hypothetical protein